MAVRRVPRGGERLKMPSACALGIFSGRIILIFGIAERLRTLRYPIFTGGVVMANGIYSACFLRKRRRCGESPPTQRSKAVRRMPDGLAALIGKDRSGDGNCYFARPSFFSRFHARMTCTLVTRLPGKNTRAPVSLQCYVCIQCTTIYPLWTVLGMNRPANALKRPGAPHAPAKNRKPPGLRLPDGFLLYRNYGNGILNRVLLCACSIPRTAAKVEQFCVNGP